MAVALLVAAFRWTSWPPKLFYAQIFLAATTILAQASANHKTYLLWRSFIVTRVRHPPLSMSGRLIGIFR